MIDFRSVEDILNYAIEREEEAAAFYANLAMQGSNPAMRQAFEDFAKEERGHKAKLLAVKGGRRLNPTPAQITDLKISDHLADVFPTDNMDYGDSLRLAMQREKASFKLYSNLAETTTDEGTRNLFLALAQEEAKHKLRLELEYDEEYLKEN